MTTTNILHQYTNGNAIVTLYESGSRTIEYDDELKLEYPLNIDIRVSTQCDFGLNPKTGKAVCSFCHESATTDGTDCDYTELLSVLSGLPKGIELAVGSNNLSNALIAFLYKCKEQGWIVNLTVNQGHLKRDSDKLKYCIDNKLVYGIGISYRKGFANIPDWLVAYENMVVHTICGIDTIADVRGLAEYGINKILILGEKDFGFNKGKVNTSTVNHLQWYHQLHTLFSKFKVVSFDNLALQQLNVKRYVSEDHWKTMYQGEHSFYIDAVAKQFARSSRSSFRRNWSDMTAKEFFTKIEEPIQLVVA